MKPKALLLLSSVLLLCGCGETPIEESSFSSMEESSSFIEESSSEEPSSSEEILLNWPGDEIASLVSSIFGSVAEIPSPTYELDEGRTYEVTSDDASITIAASGDFSVYAEVAIEAGWVEVDGPTIYEGLTHLHDEDGIIAIEVLPYDEDSDSTTITIEENGNYFGSWPKAYIEEALKIVAGKNDPVIIPEGTGFTYIYATAGSLTTGYPYLEVDVYGYEDTEAYAEAVDEDSGFFPSYYYTNAYVTSDMEYSVIWNLYSTSYGSEFAIVCRPTESVFHTGWERIANTVADYYSRLSSENPSALLPEPSEDWDIGFLVNRISSYGYYCVYFIKYGSDGLPISQSEAYMDDLENSEDWVYRSDLGGYIDAETKTLLITVSDADSNWGTLIRVQGGDYSSSALNWPGDLINGYVQTYIGNDNPIPEPSASLDEGRTYEVAPVEYFDWEVNSFYYVDIVASGDFTDYADDVLAAGWDEVEGAYTIARLFITEDTSLAIVIYNYDENSDTTEIMIQDNPGYYANWPSELVKEAMITVLGTEDFIEMPALEGAGYYQISGAAAYGYEQIYAGLGDYRDDFAEILEANGFIENSTYTYYDPNSQYSVYLSYVSLLDRTAVQIRPL